MCGRRMESPKHGGCVDESVPVMCVVSLDDGLQLRHPVKGVACVEVAAHRQ
jgi:hypothetical protein